MAQNNSVVAVYPSNDSLDLVGPAWTRFTDSGSGATLAIAQGAGSSSLKFKGTQIEVYGVLEPGPPVTSTYSIDGSSAESYTGPSDLTSSQSEVPFFLSPKLSSGEHELTINVINATANASYVLEFILYIPTSTGASNATYSSTSLHGSTATIVVANASTSSAASVGAIVGGVVGGVAGLMILGLAIYFFMRRKLASPGRPYFYQEVGAGEMLQDDLKPTDLPMTKVTPYPANTTAPSAPSLYSEPPAPSVSGSSSTQPAAQPAFPPGLAASAGGSVHSQNNAPRPTSPHQSNYSSSASASSSQRPTLTLVDGPEDAYASPIQPHSKAAEAGLLSVAKESTYHQDSGLRFNALGEGPSGAAGPSTADDIPTDVPPSYSEV